ncbi:MAG: hypothetical protein OXC71_03340 [Chloroflexi bacterium]|nr:hypothetical protein [Chloroflexota bacterium]
MTAIRDRGQTLIIALLVGVIALGAGIAVAHSDGTEIRITAMRHDDGRIEFAVQERDGEGWGERVLPRARFFPASGREGRWLSSTPIIVGVVEGSESGLAAATPTPTATPTPATAYGTATRSDYWFVSTRTDPITDVQTTSALTTSTAVVSKNWSYSSLDDPFMAIRCSGSRLEAIVFWDTFMAGRNDRLTTTYRVDQGTPVTESWDESTTNQSTFASNPDAFVTALLAGSTVVIRSVDYSDEAHTLTMRVAGLSDVMGNLTCYTN